MNVMPVTPVLNADRIRKHSFHGERQTRCLTQKAQAFLFLTFLFHINGDFQMTKFNVHTIESAPEGSKPLLESTKKAWGFVPTLHGTLAESPVALAAYDSLFGLVAKSSFTAIEQQVVYQTINVFHECEYCTAGHTYLSRAAGMPEPVIAALRNETMIPDARLEALSTFAKRVVVERGFAGDAAVDAFIAAGFTRENVLEVVTIIATKTISNYTNHLTHTPKESFMADPALNWVAPRNRLQAAA
jgi:alkylhydroperoxidase family enzyme